MSHHTSMRVGGPADLYVRPRDPRSLETVFRISEGAGLPITVIGLGTNLLVRDGGIRGVVVSTVHLTELTVEKTTLRAGAGLSLPRLSKVAAQLGLSGLEFAAGIPGTVGGGVVMNAGAHGGCLGDVLVWVELWAPGGATYHTQTAELGLEYRQSRLLKTREVVVEACFQLELGRPEEVERERQRLLALRKKTQPLGLPSAGSYFRNPAEGPAGWFIERAGCRGMVRGGAQVSPLHANFIVNRGGATAGDILTLAEEVRQRVADRFGVWLEPEVEVLGEDDTACTPTAESRG